MKLAKVRLGNEVLLESRRALLLGVRVGIVTNHTGVNSRLEVDHRPAGG